MIEFMPKDKFYVYRRSKKYVVLKFGSKRVLKSFDDLLSAVNYAKELAKIKSGVVILMNDKNFKVQKIYNFNN